MSILCNAPRCAKLVPVFNVLLVVAAVALRAPSVLAQGEPAWWTQQKRECGLSRTLAYNTWVAQGMPCNRGATAPAPSGPDPFQTGVARYEAALARLRAYGVFGNILSVFASRPSPQTPDDLSRMADDLFMGTAYRLDWLTMRSEETLRQLRDDELRLEDLREQERYLQTRDATFPAALRQANINLSRALAQAEALERVVASVESVSDQMRGRADRAATEAMQWLTVASPPGVTLVSELTVRDRRTAPRSPLLTPAPPVAPAVATPAPSILGAQRQPPLRAALPGTADEKIAAAEALFPRIDAVEEQYAARARRAAALHETLETARARVEALAAGGSEAQQRLAAVEERTARAHDRTIAAYDNRSTAGANAAAAIAEAYIFEAFRDQVVKPEVIRFLRANRVTRRLNRSLVAELYRLHRSVLPTIAGGRYVGLDRLIAVQRRALAVIWDFETYAAAAAASAASPTDATGAELAAEIHAGTEAAGQELIERAAGDPGPLHAIVRAILQRR